MNKNESSPRYYKPFETGVPTQEVEVTRLIHARMKAENCLEESERETVAYRIAEIMATAKMMYTKSLPRLTNVAGESDASMEDDLTGLHMTFLHMIDLMCEFESALHLGYGQVARRNEQARADLEGNPVEDE